MKPRLLLLISTLCLLAGCKTDVPPEASPIPQLEPAENRPVMRVSDPKRLLELIGPDRILELEPGDYVLSDFQTRTFPHLRWDRVFDGYTPTVKDVSGLTLRGTTAGRFTRIIVEPRYAFVLNFQGCSDIRLENLTLGHEPSKGTCASGVIGATDCHNLHVQNCDLFGCGTEGLTLKGVRNFVMRNSVIRDCTYGIMTLTESANIRFHTTSFVRNQEFHGVVIDQVKDVLIEKCVFKYNQASEYLFRVHNSENVRIKGCTIDMNDVPGVLDAGDSVTIEVE